MQIMEDLNLIDGANQQRNTKVPMRGLTITSITIPPGGATRRRCKRRNSSVNEVDHVTAKNPTQRLQHVAVCQNQ